MPKHLLTLSTLIVLWLAGCASTPSSVVSAPALTPPAEGPITVAILIAPEAEVVDFAGPWGVFQYARADNHQGPPFELYSVAETAAPVTCFGGMVVVPRHTFASAPPAKVIVVPAMGEPSPALLAWLREASQHADVTISVCNGAFVLAKAGLLDGKTATAHHGGYGMLAAMFPKVTVRRGARFVDDGAISTAGGLTSGIDLALHVVERYYGRAAAEQTALDLEYQGAGWKAPDSNAMFAARPVSTDARPICPVCEMEVSKTEALSETVRGRVIYFCSEECKKHFDAHPDRFQQP
jgi:putative intracellular protease/amidase/YHS domain-containing protein